MDGPFFVYILASRRNGTLYVGVTNNLARRMLEHKEADRVVMTETLWGSTLDRWHREGLPEEVRWEEYFGLDRFGSIWADNSPQFPWRTIEQTDDWIPLVVGTRWEYVPAEPSEEFDALVAVRLTHLDDEGTGYLASTRWGNRPPASDSAGR